jgi:polyisoprenyl-teichoic acid--peptidoglycan teichoic acid transferase
VRGATGGNAPTSSPGATAEPQPSPTPKPPTNRVTFLLMGVDSTPNRTHSLTDTLLVVSIDKVDKTAVMLSIPRDVARFQLYSGGTYNGKINSLMSAARSAPSRYPDGPAGTLMRQIGFIVGMQIDYYAQINIQGFERMVDLVGGVDVDNPKWINDPRYDWFDGTSGFSLSPGKHHLNGRLALAYARSRQGAGDNDFTRARRQQQILVALRQKVTSPRVLERLPELLKVAGRTIKTDFPADQIRDYLGLGKEIEDAAIERHVLGPPYARPPGTPGSTYVLLLDMERVAKLSIDVFGTDSDYFDAASPAVP